MTGWEAGNLLEYKACNARVVLLDGLKIILS